jgi:hypothetical protein
MIQSIINGIVPVMVTVIIGILVATIKSVGDVIIEYIEKKKEAVITEIGINKYNSDLAIARSVWNIVEEYFRINPSIEKTMEAAQKKFEEEILKIIPGLTTAEVEQLRQAIAGEINKGKQQLLIISNDDKNIVK